MKTLISSLVLGAVLSGTLGAAELETLNTAPKNCCVGGIENGKTSTPAGWTDDMEAAKKQAANEGKQILVNFTGSDWCAWCAVLEREVFSQKEFLDAAKDKFVLVFIDSPQDKSLLSESAKSQNKKLVNDYGIRGFPTVLVLDAGGKLIAKTGYMRGGAKAYLKHLEALVEGHNAIVGLEKEIRDLEAGSELRVNKIHETMKDLCAEEQLKYRAMIEEVLAFDSDGSAEMREAYPLFTVYLPLAEYVRSVSSAIHEDVCAAYEKTTSEERKNPDISRKIFIDAATKHVGELQACMEKIEESEAQIPQGELSDWVRELKRQIAVQLAVVAPTPKAPAAETEEKSSGEIFED